MLNPGMLIGNSLEVGSMAAAIEAAMIDQGVLVLDDETPEAAESRRKAFIAIATGVVEHLVANIEILVAASKFGTSVPAAATTLLGAAGEVK